MTRPLTISGNPLNFFIPGKSGLTRAQADTDPGLPAQSVADVDVEKRGSRLMIGITRG
jgi:hypothetical protein